MISVHRWIERYTCDLVIVLVWYFGLMMQNDYSCSFFVLLIIFRIIGILLSEVSFLSLCVLFFMQYLITHFSDFQLACLGSFFLHESVFFFSGLPFIYLERAGLLSKYKIQVSLLDWLLLSKL